jgi:CRP-like cAMP-binding protein
MCYQLCRSLRYVDYKHGQTIFRKDAESDLFFFIIDGGVALHVGKSINSKMVRVMIRGESLGEKGIINYEPRSLSAFAKGFTRLIAVKAEDFRKIMAIEFKEQMHKKINFIKKN